MSIYYLEQNNKRCISCRACQVQCKINKGLGVGPKPSQVIDVGPADINGLPKANYVFMSCFHCEDPWCVAACPTGAMQKRPKDGIVFINQDLCAGCKSCIMACPWGAPQWDAQKGKVVKCDYCKDRIDAGLKPACVAACPTNSLNFGLTSNLPNTKRDQYARKIYSIKAG